MSGDSPRPVKAAFDATAASYDASRRLLIPCFDDFYGMVVRLAPFPRDAAIDVLDLGAGTGLLAGVVRDAFPNARLTLVDISDDMLNVARERFAGDAAVGYATADYASEPIPGEYDLIVSALSIHHLSDAEKADLFRRCLQALRPGGAFVNADQVLGASPAITEFNRAEWRRESAANGAPEAEIVAAEERQKHDILSTLEAQLAWLRDAGFTDVDCHFKHLWFAVYAGRK